MSADTVYVWRMTFEFLLNIWTHYYDELRMKRKRGVMMKFCPLTPFILKKSISPNFYKYIYSVRLAVMFIFLRS